MASELCRQASLLVTYNFIQRNACCINHCLHQASSPDRPVVGPQQLTSTACQVRFGRSLSDALLDTPFKVNVGRRHKAPVHIACMMLLISLEFSPD